MYTWRMFKHSAFTWATGSQRRRLAKVFDAKRNWPAAILFYHRVADVTPNPWTISERGFADQLDLFADLGTFASLQEIQAEQHSGVRDRLKIAVTFDDGYRDNLQYAIPLMQSRKVPCTYFVTTDNVERGIPFPHDVERGKPLAVHTPSEIRDLADAGIEIGGHTATHLDLGKIWSRDRLLVELRDSRRKLQDWSGQPVNYFAFPFGLMKNISQAAIDIVVEAGYRGFVSAYGAWNHPGHDDFHLTRFHGDPCTAALRNWLTLDPRKINEPSQLRYTRSTKEATLPLASVPSWSTSDVFSASL
jgi:peptidoglycan/xylan/chitin deacetylase (PgdA/CDA1 family)